MTGVFPLCPGVGNREAVSAWLQAGWRGAHVAPWRRSPVGAVAWGSKRWGFPGPRRVGGVGGDVQAAVVVAVGGGSFEPGRWGPGTPSIGCPVYAIGPVAQPGFVGLVCNRPRCE